MKCENCVSNGGLIHCELLDRDIPTAGDGEPYKPTDCPLNEVTDDSCATLPPFNPPPATIFPSERDS